MEYFTTVNPGIVSQVESLEAIDDALLRNILKAHSKTPTEFLYLETEAVSLWWIIAQRRIIFMKHIDERHEDKLTKKVFLAQKEHPNKGDFVLLVEKD